MPTTATTAEPIVRQMLDGEALLGLADAAKLLPGYRGNASLDPSCVLRWVLTGSKSARGKVVKLEAIRMGNRWLTSREALARFSAALSAVPGETPTPPPTPAAQGRAGKQAAKKLVELGA